MARILSTAMRAHVLAFGEALFARDEEGPPPDRMAWFVDDLDDFVACLNTRARWLFLACMWTVAFIAPVLRGRLARLGALPLTERIRALDALEKTPAALALFAARALASLVYYEHPDAGAEIGWDRRSLLEARAAGEATTEARP